MVHQKTRLIHSLQLKNFLIGCGFEPIEELPNPFKENFLSWKFLKTKEFERLIELYALHHDSFEEMQVFMINEVQNGNLYFLKDLAPKISMEDCVYIIDKEKKFIYKIKK